MSKDPGPEGPALVHPSFRLGERGDMRDYVCNSVQVSGVGCRVSAGRQTDHRLLISEWVSFFLPTFGKGGRGGFT